MLSKSRVNQCFVISPNHQPILFVNSQTANFTVHYPPTRRSQILRQDHKPLVLNFTIIVEECFPQQLTCSTLILLSYVPNLPENLQSGQTVKYLCYPKQKAVVRNHKNKFCSYRRCRMYHTYCTLPCIVNPYFYLERSHNVTHLQSFRLWVMSDCQNYFVRGIQKCHDSFLMCCSIQVNIIYSEDAVTHSQFASLMGSSSCSYLKIMEKF